MRWKQIITVSLFIPALFLFNILFKLLPSPMEARILGEHRIVEGRSVVSIYEAEHQNRSGVAVATLEHEMLHALKNKGYFDRDVPYAAALGFYVEWKKNRRLFEDVANELFLKGMSAPVPEKEISSLVETYGDNAREDERSYRDAAYLTGLTVRLFQGNVDAGERFIFCLSMNLAPQSAMNIAQDRKAYEVLLGLRRGIYTLVDEKRFSSDISQMPTLSHQLLISYKDKLTREYDMTYTVKSSAQKKAFGGSPE